MATLYLVEQGARVEKEYRQLLVCKEGEVLQEVKLARLERVVVLGRVGFTTPALLALMDAGIPLVFLTRQGKVRGRLAGRTGGNLALRHRQYERSGDPVFCLELARSVVSGKLVNYRTLAMRMLRSHPQESGSQIVHDLHRYVQQTEAAESLATLRGIEGAGTRAYFQVLRGCLPEEFEFPRRARRPPPDPVNALLSLAYTLLGESIFAALEVVGLDPYDGFFHSDAYNRPALALDLVEEFRGVVADSVVLALLNRRVLRLRDFVWRGEGVYLRPEALKQFLKAYTRRLNTRVRHPFWDQRLSYQQVFEAQARILVRVIQGELGRYEPFWVK